MKYLKEIDEKLFQLEKDLDFYSFINPINSEEEKKVFFSHIENGQVYNPRFNYKKSNLSFYRRKLNNLLDKIDNGNLLEKLFIDKITYMQKKLDMLGASDHEFSSISIDLYGGITKSLVDKAKRILTVYPQGSEEEKIAPCEMVKQLKMELQIYSLKWEVKLNSEIISKISILPNSETVYVNVNYSYTEAEVERLKIHEMVHILRAVNGNLQSWKIFKNGLDRYEETEEGLAVWTESEKGKLDFDKRQVRVYAGKLLAIYYGLHSSFYNTFCKIKKYFSSKMAYRLTERTKRGLKNTKIKGAFTKDSHYLRGCK